MKLEILESEEKQDEIYVQLDGVKYVFNKKFYPVEKLERLFNNVMYLIDKDYYGIGNCYDYYKKERIENTAEFVRFIVIKEQDSLKTKLIESYVERYVLIIFNCYSKEDDKIYCRPVEVTIKTEYKEILEIINLYKQAFLSDV